MFQFINEWFLQTVAMMLTALLLPKLKITSIFGAFGAVVGLALLNASVWDAALFLSVPDTLSLQALVLVLSNGVFFLLLVKFLPGIEVDSILVAIIAPIIFAISRMLIQKYGHLVDWGAVFNKIVEVISYLKVFIQGSPEAFLYIY